MDQNLQYQLALVKLKGIGPVNTRKLIAECGGVEAIFKATSPSLEKIPNIPRSVSDQHERERVLKEVEGELTFLEKNNVQTHFFLDKSYPERLKHCNDAPILLFSRGNVAMNPAKSIAFVGTRKATEYGKRMVDKLIGELVQYDPLIMSGLAVGIDIEAHRCALKHGLQTIGCLGSGMDKVYPSYHKKTAKDMEQHGGIVTEFWSGTGPDRENFPQRNRIVAGMVDLLVVVESTRIGGSMITAKIAHSYNREIMAVPGRMDDGLSEGTNLLIQRQQAGIITDTEDIVKYMGWDLEKPKKTATQQQQLFLDLNEPQQKLVSLLQNKGKMELDKIAVASELPIAKTSAQLLELEFAGVVKSLPGKVYTLT